MKISNLKQTCWACPSQWEFITDDNRPVYVRYRHGYLSVCIGKPDGDIASAVEGNEILGKDIGNELDGYISWRDIEPMIRELKIE